jgi:hypothetical protein
LIALIMSSPFGLDGAKRGVASCMGAAGKIGAQPVFAILGTIVGQHGADRSGEPLLKFAQ